MYVLEKSEFKYNIFDLLRHKCLTFFKMEVVNTNAIISQKLRHFDVVGYCGG